jgi:hypothetical protein
MLKALNGLQMIKTLREKSQPRLNFQMGLNAAPMQRVMKRFKNGFEDSVYTYGYELKIHNRAFRPKFLDYE